MSAQTVPHVMSLEPIQIRVIAYREGDAWIAQCIEYDITAHASDPSELPMAFTRALAEYVCITQQLGREPLAGIKPAPERFKALFETASSELRPVNPQHLPAAPFGGVDIRITSHAA